MVSLHWHELLSLTAYKITPYCF